MSLTLAKKTVSVKTQTLATLMAIVAAILVPQVFHVAGRLLGVGTALGEIFLPMHLPIILVGLLAGPYAGGIAGILSPLVSFMLTGMPSAVVLPLMMVEVGFYGLTAGIMRNVKTDDIVKVVVAQVSGRAMRLIVTAVLFALTLTKVNPIGVFTAVRAGIVGLLLQWSILPIISTLVKSKK